MSQQAPAGSVLDRLDELEQQVEEQSHLIRALQAQNRRLKNIVADHPDDIDAWEPQRMDGVVPRVEHLEEELADARERVTVLEEQLDCATKESKVAAIVRAAANLRSGDQPAVSLTNQDIVAATGVSRRYGYDLMDDLPEQYAWAHELKELSRYGDAEVDKDAGGRRLVVDFDGVHGSPCPVNKFTTRRGGETTK